MAATSTGAGRRILIATLVAGTLDILAAAGLATHAGRTPDRMLRSVASGPFPDAAGWGAGGAALGLAVHFAIMAAMAAAYVLGAGRIAWLRRNWAAGGLGWGLVTWAAMNLVVLPLRWPGHFPDLGAQAVVTSLACHILLVGLPIALIAARR